MPRVSDIMSTDVQVVEPQQTLQWAAQLMQTLDVGALPVCSGKRLLGMITDRDLAVRGVAAGLQPAQACVSDVMTPHVRWCTEDQDTDDVIRMMGEAQVRRMPVVNEDCELVGIVSISDLALRQRAIIDVAVREKPDA